MNETTQHDIHLATCGHEDMMGWLAKVPCGACTRKAHRQATNPSSKQNKRK